MRTTISCRLLNLLRYRNGKYDIVGPVCESGDTFAKHREMAPLKSGDLVAFRSAGAYGAVMASEYNSRPLIPEVLVQRRSICGYPRTPDL